MPLTRWNRARTELVYETRARFNHLASLVNGHDWHVDVRSVELQSNHLLPCLPRNEISKHNY
jgi:hypothetical protein